MNSAMTAETLLALRAPDTGWLGVLACVLDEASRDPQFDERQRALAMQLLEYGPLPAPVVDAARQRAARFEAELDDDATAPVASAPAPMRPKLTLVGN